MIRDTAAYGVVFLSLTRGVGEGSACMYVQIEDHISNVSTPIDYSDRLFTSISGCLDFSGIVLPLCLAVLRLLTYDIQFCRFRSSIFRASAEKVAFGSSRNGRRWQWRRLQCYHEALPKASSAAYESHLPPVYSEGGC